MNGVGDSLFSFDGSIDIKVDECIYSFAGNCLELGGKQIPHPRRARVRNDSWGGCDAVVSYAGGAKLRLFTFVGQRANCFREFFQDFGFYPVQHELAFAFALDEARFGEDL